MKRIPVLLLLLLASRVVAITVEVEQVLDAPPTKWGTFLADSAAYASNGELLFMSSLALNLFVLKDGYWVRLVDQYRTEQYNHTEEQERSYGYNALYNSTIPGEFIYFIRQRPLPEEYYRVFVDEDGELRAEWVSQGYYDSHQTPGLGQGLSLMDGYQVELRRVTDFGEGQAWWPDIVDSEGRLIYRITQDFRGGFVEDLWTILIISATNPLIVKTVIL